MGEDPLLEFWRLWLGQSDMTMTPSCQSHLCKHAVRVSYLEGLTAQMFAATFGIMDTSLHISVPGSRLPGSF